MKNAKINIGINVVCKWKTTAPMTFFRVAKCYMFTLFFFFGLILTSLGQSCDNRDSFIDFLFDVLLNSNDINTVETNKTKNVKPIVPLVRSEKTEWKYGVSVMGVPKNIGYKPMGVELGLYTRAFSSKKFYLGISSTFYPLKGYVMDSVFQEFDKIRTNQNIFSLNLAMKYNIIKIKKFQLALGLHAGTMIFSARTFAQDNTCDCDGKKTPNHTMKKFTSGRPDYGASINLQFALKNPYEKIFIEVMKQSPGNTIYLEKDGVEVKPNKINYPLVENNWSMLVFKIGISQYF